MTLSYRRIPQAKIDCCPYPVTGEAGSSADAAATCATEELSQEEHLAQELQRAYNAGCEAARAACMKEVADEIALKAGSFASMIDDLVSQRQRLINESEGAVVRLACMVARRIIGEAVEVNEQAIVDVVKNAIRHLSDKQKLIIRVNPDDLVTLREHKSEWMKAAGAGSSVEVNEDSRIKRGGCLVEGESGSVEAQIDRQIEVIERALVEAAK